VGGCLLIEFLLQNRPQKKKSRCLLLGSELSFLRISALSLTPLFIGGPLLGISYSVNNKSKIFVTTMPIIAPIANIIISSLFLFQKFGASFLDLKIIVLKRLSG
jgi:hypothetical protein